MLSRFLDILFPRRCLMCSGVLAHGEDVLCLSCLMQAPVITSQDFREGEMCRLFWHTLPIERAAAMFRYEHSSPWRALVTYGKFRHRHDALAGLGRIMGRHFMRQGFFDGIDVIVPMPTGADHLRSRGYNQAALLARGVGKVTGLPVIENAVVRRSGDISQTRRSRLERLVAVKGSFTVKKPELLADRHVLLIDDVCTTGSSLMALGESLRAIPRLRLSVLTLARTISI